MPKGASETCQQALQNFKRQALHAGLLGFIHPKTEQEVSWRIDIPDDMQTILNILADDMLQEVEK